MSAVGATKKGLAIFPAPGGAKWANIEGYHRILAAIRLGRWTLALMREKR